MVWGRAIFSAPTKNSLPLSSLTPAWTRLRRDVGSPHLWASRNCSNFKNGIQGGKKGKDWAWALCRHACRTPRVEQGESRYSQKLRFSLYTESVSHLMRYETWSFLSKFPTQIFLFSFKASETIKLTSLGFYGSHIEKATRKEFFLQVYIGIWEGIYPGDKNMKIGEKNSHVFCIEGDRISVELDKPIYIKAHQWYTVQFVLSVRR